MGSGASPLAGWKHPPILMIKEPVEGQLAWIHYRKSLQEMMPLEGFLVQILAVAAGRGPRNVLVCDYYGDHAVVPRGNLFAYGQ